MNSTSSVMRSEAKRLRSLAQRLEAFAAELDGPPPAQTITTRTQDNLGAVFGEYHGMSQSAAILKALEIGPQTTKELFERLNAGGQKIKKRTYVTALLGRLKEKVERNAEGKVQLKSNGV